VVGRSGEPGWKAAAVPQGKVDARNIRALLAGRLEGVGGGPRLRANPQIGLGIDQLAQTSPHNGMILDDENRVDGGSLRGHSPPDWSAPDADRSAYPCLTSARGFSVQRQTLTPAPSHASPTM
jgi:hypothetical protein